MEDEAREASPLPWGILLYVPLFLYWLHRLDAMTLGVAKVLATAITTLYFLVPVVVLGMVLGESMGLRKVEKLRTLFATKKPSGRWLLAHLVLFVLVPVLGWICFR